MEADKTNLRYSCRLCLEFSRLEFREVHCCGSFESLVAVDGGVDFSTRKKQHRRRLLTGSVGFRLRMAFFFALRPPAFCRLLDGLHVRQILPSSRSKLGGDKIVFRNKERREAGLRVK